MSRYCVCGHPVVEGSPFCANHRALFRQVGGAEPDPLHELIVNARNSHYVMSVDEIAAALGCEPDQVRERLRVLRAAGKARPMLPDFMTRATYSDMERIR